MTLAVLVALAACRSNRHNPSQEDALPQCTRPQPVEQRTYIVFFDQHAGIEGGAAKPGCRAVRPGRTANIAK